MTRFLSSSLQAQSQEQLLAYRNLVDVGVTSGYVYFCTGKQFIGPNSYVANTYTPVGGIGEIEALQEESDVFPRSIILRLSGVNTWASGSMSLYEPLRESMFGRSVKIYRAYLDPNNWSMTNTPELINTWKTVRVDVRPMEGVYELEADLDLRRGAKVQYFNRETFRAVDSSDTFGNWIDQIPLFKGSWGGMAVDFAGTSRRSTSTGNAKTDALNRVWNQANGG